jgi:hypothetical protein
VAGDPWENTICPAAYATIRFATPADSRNRCVSNLGAARAFRCFLIAIEEYRPFEPRHLIACAQADL